MDANEIWDDMGRTMMEAGGDLGSRAAVRFVQGTGDGVACRVIGPDDLNAAEKDGANGRVVVYMGTITVENYAVHRLDKYDLTVNGSTMRFAVSGWKDAANGMVDLSVVCTRQVEKGRAALMERIG